MHSLFCHTMLKYYQSDTSFVRQARAFIKPANQGPPFIWPIRLLLVSGQLYCSFFPANQEPPFLGNQTAAFTQLTWSLFCLTNQGLPFFSANQIFPFSCLIRHPHLYGQSGPSTHFVKEINTLKSQNCFLIWSELDLSICNPRVNKNKRSYKGHQFFNKKYKIIN